MILGGLNVIYILFVGILLLLFCSFYIFRKNLLNPSVVLCLAFLLSVFFLMLNAKTWGVQLSDKTVLIVFFTLLIFIFGNLTIYIFYFSNRKKILKKEDSFIIPRVSFKLVIIIDFFLILGLIHFIKNVYELSLIGGNPGGYKDVLYYVRIAKLNFHDISRLNMNIFYFAKAISYICMYSFIYLALFKGFKVKYLYLLSPVPFFLTFVVLSAARIDIIYLFIYIITIFVILLYKRENFHISANKKIIIGTSIFWGIAIVLFFISGKLFLGRSDINVFSSVSRYTGSSLAALNEFLNNFETNNNEYFGQNTLFSVYRILKRFKPEIPNFYPSYEFSYFTGMRTNIYSAIRRYIEDYSILGHFLITFCLGIFYGIFFEYIAYKRKDFLLIMYATLSFPVYEFPIEERFFQFLLPSGFINNFIFIGLVYYFFIYRINLKNNKKLK